MAEWFKKKIVIRIIYTTGSYLTAQTVTFLTGDYLEVLLKKVMALASGVGIPLVIQLAGPINEKLLSASITGLLMIAGELIIHPVHENIVKPKVAPTGETNGPGIVGQTVK